MGLFDLFRRKAEAPPPEPEKEDLSVYSGMRVEVTDRSGCMLFVAKLTALRGDRAELLQYSDNSEAEDASHEAEPVPVNIRGYHDHERKAVYMEGNIVPRPHHVWQVEDLVVTKISNDRAFFRLETNLEATVTTFGGGFGAGEKPCTLLNISVGGARITSESIYHEGDKFLLKVQLLEDRDLSAMYCQVLRVIPQKDGKLEYGCRFLELNEADQTKITQNIFAAQRQQRGAGRVSKRGRGY